MGYRVNFTDNELVTSEALSLLTEELGDGVLAFEDDMLYGVDNLNAISGALITKGVSRGCTLSIPLAGTVCIGEGVLYMNDGRQVVIDAEGVMLTYTPGTVHYVWFFKDVITGLVVPRCTTEAPGGADFVVLGCVTAESAIGGRPDRAVMKNPFLGIHGTESFSKSFYWDGTAEEKLLWEIEPEDSGYTYLLAQATGTDGDRISFCGFVNLSDGTSFSNLSTITYGYSVPRGFSYESANGEMLVDFRASDDVRKEFYVYLRFALEPDGMLRVYQRAVQTSSAGGGNRQAMTITITFC